MSPFRLPGGRRWIRRGAAAVAAGLVPFALASDTGGSVRIPAALCGCVGFRPTTGRYSTDGFVPVSPTFDAPGLIAPSSADVQWLDQLIANPAESTSEPPPDLAQLRVGVPREYFYDDLAPVVSKRMDKALAAARDARMTLVYADIGEFAELNAHVGFPIAFYEMLRGTAIFLAREKVGISLGQLIDGVKGRVERQALLAQLAEQPIDRATYVKSLTVNLPEYVAKIDAHLDAHGLDAIAVPTTTLPAVAHRSPDHDGELTHNGKTASTFLSYVRNTEPFSNYGGPCVNHVELVRRARGVKMPESFRSDPLMYQGGSDSLVGPRAPVVVASEDWGIDFEAEVAVITGDVPMGVAVEDAAAHVRLITIVNDVSLRNLIPGELAKGFGFLQSKPPSAFAPVAVTPDELGGKWRNAKVHLPLRSYLNNRLFGRPNAGVDMQFDFGQLIAHAARSRPLVAGSIIGSGAVSNKLKGGPGKPIADGGVGYSCIAEMRTIETIEAGAPKTPFLQFGDRVRMEMLDEDGESIFGAIDQEVRQCRSLS